MISSIEFRTAMKVFGTKENKTVDKYLQPCYTIRGINFSFFADTVTWLGDELPEEILEKAREILSNGNNQIEDSHFENHTIYTVKGLLTIAALLENKYTKEYIENLLNQTYKRILKIVNPGKMPKDGLTKIQDMLDEFKKCVNPFESGFDLKDPIEYIDIIKTSIQYFQDPVFPFKISSVIQLERKYIKTFLKIKYHKQKYGTRFNIVENGHLVDIVITYNKICDDSDGESFRETLTMTVRETARDKINMTIDLKTGKVWKYWDEDKAQKASSEILEKFIFYLKKANEAIKNRITSKMIKKE